MTQMKDSGSRVSLGRLFTNLVNALTYESNIVASCAGIRGAVHLTLLHLFLSVHPVLFLLLLCPCPFLPSPVFFLFVDTRFLVFVASFPTPVAGAATTSLLSSERLVSKFLVKCCYGFLVSPFPCLSHLSHSLLPRSQVAPSIRG